MTNFTVQDMQLANGQTLSFDASDIILIVGRNSSGKSTFLREILSCVQNHGSDRKIISGASFRGSSALELRARVLSYFRVVKEGVLEFVRSKSGGTEFHLPSFDGGPDRLRLGQAARAFVTLLNAEGRLSLTRDVDTVDIHNSKPNHPFHVFMVEPDTLKRTSDIIKRAFGVDRASYAAALAPLVEELRAVI